jgi:alpha-methylacyl-CoA racemase
VLTLEEAPHHPHNVARGTFIEVDGIIQPAPAPRFSRTPAGKPTPPEAPGERGNSSLAQWGLTADEIAGLKRSGVLA